MTLSILFVSPTNPHPLATYLDSLAPITVHQTPTLPTDLGGYASVIIEQSVGLSPAEPDPQHLRQFVASGGNCIMLSDASGLSLPAWFGVQPHPPGPRNELRVLFTNQTHPLAVRLPDAFYTPGQYQPLTLADGVETILYADWQFTHIPVVTRQQLGGGNALFSTLTAFDQPLVQRFYYRLLCHLTTPIDANRTLGVGLLGYSPAVGQLHGQGTALTAGLELRAACDLNPARLDEAQRDFPEMRLYHDAADMAANPNLDIVIITTAPNIHARLSMQMLDAGKHVVCEKPLALTRAETDSMREAAARNNRLICCHQNRRWDVDYLAVKQALADNLIGEVFYMETFVGSYHHPCGYWHSHAPVSGGTTYDWGAHYLDWTLSLMPHNVTGVISTRHKRVWHDVTNADQERIMLRFAGGQEAEFTHSDIAAIPKPKWYVLGTEGAIVGHWQHVTSYDPDPVLYFQEREIPSTEMPPKLVVQKRHAAGHMVEQRLTPPPRRLYPFHSNLADHLLLDEPLTVPVEETARVVAVLEAAVRSAKNGGTIELPHG